jgi:hypothetical protein
MIEMIDSEFDECIMIDFEIDFMIDRRTMID